MSRPFVTRPWFWLAFQAALLGVLFLRWDHYRLFPTDTDYYVDVALGTDWLSLEQALASYRTFGYPLFVRAVLWVSPTLTALPICHLAARVLAVFAFYAGLRQLGVRGWLAAAIASSFYYCNTIFFGYAGLLTTYVLSDSLGESLTILTAALLLVVLGRPGSVLGWAGLVLSLFLTYQVRPLLQFLVVLLPVLGLVLLRLFAERPEWVRRRLRLGLGLAAAGLLPLLAWCTLRLAMVGHFGLVSFSGHALVSIAGHFLSADLVPEFPEDLRPFAQAVLKKRDELASGQVETLFGITWRPALDEDGWLRAGAVEDQYMLVITQSQLFEATASEMFPENPILQDRKLQEIATAIIKARPRYYLMWLAQSARVTLYWAFTGNFTFNLLIYLFLGLLGVWLALVVIGRWRGPGLPPEEQRPRADHFGLELAATVPLAVGVALANAAVIIVLGQPLPRYAATGGVFLPAAAVVALVAVGTRIVALWPWFREKPPAPAGAAFSGPHGVQRFLLKLCGR